MNTQRSCRQLEPDRDERGTSLILVLVITLLLFLLGMSVLSVTDIEHRTSRTESDAIEALSDTDNAINEVLWRLNLEPGAAPPPTGSQIDVNNLVNYDAAIDPDPWDLLTNEVDDDLDGMIDDADELRFNHEWQVRVVLSPDEPNPGFPFEVTDSLPLLGPPFGSKLVEATVQPRANWRVYSAETPGDTRVMTIRFKTDEDTDLDDSELDGREMVFYNRNLVTNGEEDFNTLSALGGDANPDNDSPYNITWSDGVTEYPASGSPVLLLNTTARIVRGGRATAERRVEAEIAYPWRQVMSKALCGCAGTNIVGAPVSDAYRSSEGVYGVGPTYDAGHIGSNGDLDIDGEINGDAEANGNITGADSVTGDTVAGGTIAGDGGGGEYPDTDPPPVACECTMDVDGPVNDAMATNDNASLIPQCQGPNLTLNGTKKCTLNTGVYYYDTIKVTGNGEIIVGDVSLGPVQIFVSGALDIGGNGLTNASRPENLQIVASTTSPDDISFTGTSAMVAVVYAPNADLNLSGDRHISGAIVGREVTMNGNPNIHYDLDLADVWYVKGRYQVIAWRELD